MAQDGIEGRAGAGAKPLVAPAYGRPAPNPFAPSTTPAPAQPACPPDTETGYLVRTIHFGWREGRRLPGLDEDTLRSAVACYEGKRLTTEQILALRDELTRRIVAAGYINSGAVVRELEASSGVLDIELVAGSLADAQTFQVEGHLSGLNRSYISKRMALPVGAPLLLADLQQKFRNLVSDPGIAQISAQLVPTDDLGVATLRLQVEAADPFILDVTAASDRSPSVGGSRFALQSQKRNALFSGDLATGEIGRAEGLVDGMATYAVPLSVSDWRVNFSANGSDAKIIEKPLNELDIISQSWSASAGISRPLLRHYSPDGRDFIGGSLGADLVYNWSRSELLGSAFSFSPGAVDGRTRYWSLRLSSDWIFKETRQALAIRGSLNRGLNALSPSVKTDLTPPKHFLTLGLQSRYSRQLTRTNQQLVARFDVQWTDDPQFATEKFTFGGESSVRGYRKNEGLSDKGLFSSIEYRVPIASLGFVPVEGLLQYFRNTTITAFAEDAHGWNAKGPDPIPDKLVSTGIAIDWSPVPWLQSTVNWSWRISKVPDHADSGLQDWGLGFRVTARAY